MTHIEITKRREDVRRLYVMGWSTERIAEQLVIPIQTVYNDLAVNQIKEKELRENNQKLIEDTSRGISEMLIKYQQIEKEAWVCYLSILLPVEKIKALTALTKLYGEVAKLLKLIDYGQGVNIEKYVNIENLVPQLNQIIMVIDKYIPEEKRLEVLKELEQLSILKENKINEPGE